VKRDKNTPLVQLFPDARLYVENGTWYVRINLENRKQPERSTRVKYQPNDQLSQSYATTRASEIYRELKQKQASGLPLASTTIAQLAIEHLATAKKGYLTNKKLMENGLPPTEYIAEGKDGSIWDKSNYDLARRTIKNYITNKKPHQTDINKGLTHTRYFDIPKNNKSIELITAQDINAWVAWKSEIFLNEQNPRKAPSSIRKQHQVMRAVFKLARRKGLINDFPKVPDPPAKTIERRRREVTGSEWSRILKYARDKIGDMNSSNQKYSYLWYMYLNTVELTGIRPWQTVKSAIKLENIRFSKDRKKNETIHIWREEKVNKGSWVAAEPYFRRIYDRIMDFHMVNEIETEYLFPHPATITKSTGKVIYKGDPIASFNNQWQNMLKHFGWHNPNAELKDRLTQYGIRHRYAGRRLRENPEIPIITLAKQMRTSATMLSNIYTHLDNERDYAEIVAGSFDASKTVDVYGESGWIKTCPRNSDFHYLAYYKSPELRVEQPELSWDDYIATTEEA